VENYDERVDNSIDVAPNISSSLLGTESGYVEVWGLDNQDNRIGLLDNIPAKWIQPNDPTQAENYSENYVVFREPAEPISLISIDNVEINGGRPPFHTENKLSDVNLSFDVFLSSLGKDLKKCLRDLTLDYFYDNYYLDNELSLDLLSNIDNDLSTLPVESNFGSIGRENVDIGLSLDNESASFTLSGSLEPIHKGFSKLEGVFGSHSISWTVSSATDWSDNTATSENVATGSGSLELDTFSTLLDSCESGWTYTENDPSAIISGTQGATDWYNEGAGSLKIQSSGLSSSGEYGGFDENFDLSSVANLSVDVRWDGNGDTFELLVDGSVIDSLTIGTTGPVTTTIGGDVSGYSGIHTVTVRQYDDPNTANHLGSGDNFWFDNLVADNYYPSGSWTSAWHSYAEEQVIDNITQTVENVGGGLQVKVQTTDNDAGNMAVDGDTGWLSITSTGTVTKTIGDIQGTFVRVKYDMTRGSTPRVADFTITTNEPPNTPENLSPAGRIASTTSASITADIVDPEGDNVNVHFWDNETGNLIDNVWVTSGSTASVTWSGLSDGQTYSYKVSAKDNYGTFSDNSYTESFTVNTPPNSPENLSPSGTIESSAVDISAVAVDNESDNVTVYFYDNSDDSLIGSAQVGSGENATVTWEGLSSKDYSFYTKAGDNWDNSSQSAVQTFTVQLSDEPTISQVQVNSDLIDKDATTSYNGVYENLVATVRVSDNNGWGTIKRLGAWVRDNNDSVLVDNVRVLENTQVDSKTLDFAFKFDPSDNADIGKYDLRFQSLDNASLTDNYPYSPDFSVDDVEKVTINVADYGDGTVDVDGHAELLSGRTLTLTKAKVVDSQEGEISIGTSDNDYSGTYGISKGPHNVHVDVKASVSSYLDGTSDTATFTYSGETGGGGLIPLPSPLSVSIEIGTTVDGTFVEQSVFHIKNQVTVNVYATSNGTPVDARVTTFWSHGGTEEKIEMAKIREGQYRGFFTVPEGIREGTYVVSANASKPGYKDASATKTFSVGVGPIPWWAKFQDELVIVGLIFLALLPIIVARVR